MASLSKLIFGTKKIRPSNKIKILSIQQNDTFGWWSHTWRVRLRINSMVKNLQGVGSCFSADTCRKAINAFVEPHFLYSATVWDNGVPTETARMDTVLIYAG